MLMERRASMTSSSQISYVIFVLYYPFIASAM
jgi:hypothetical protein